MGRLSLYTHIAIAALAGVLVWYFQAARLGAELDVLPHSRTT